MIPYTITNTTVSAIVAGKAYSFPLESILGQRLLSGIRSGAPDSEIRAALDMPSVVAQYTFGRIQLLSDGTATLNTPDGVEQLPQVLRDRLMQCLELNVPAGHLISFIERLWANPSRRSREQLYAFLEHKNLPITPQGTFLGYKAVREDFTDVHTGKVDNHPGQAPWMKRRDVDDDPDNYCSYGYHVGSLEYATAFQPPDGHLLIVEVDPADVVSVPKDCACQKLRTCRYRVIQEYAGPLPKAAVTGADNPYQAAEEEPELPFEEDDYEITVRVCGAVPEAEAIDIIKRAIRVSTLDGDAEVDE